MHVGGMPPLCLRSVPRYSCKHDWAQSNSEWKLHACAGAGRAFEALHAIQFCQQLVDDTVCYAGGVMAPLRS